MCDYSLEMYASRPARESERYVTTRFPSGSVGFASPGDTSCAICVQYDTRLVLEDIPQHVQAQCGVSPKETVTFARIETGAYHDAIRFADGRVLSLQHLGPGVSASLVTLLEKDQKVKIEELAF
jgi:hypothetical protein